jgi:hypothetical protein
MTTIWNVNLCKLNTDTFSGAITVSIEDSVYERSAHHSSQQVLGRRRSRLSRGQALQDQGVKKVHDESREMVWKAIWDWIENSGYTITRNLTRSTASGITAGS